MNTYSEFIQTAMLIVAIGRFVYDIIRARHDDIKKK